MTNKKDIQSTIVLLTEDVDDVDYSAEAEFLLEEAEEQK